MDALVALRDDHGFLTACGAFPEALITAWVQSKIDGELREVDVRPHPFEYALYLDV